MSFLVLTIFYQKSILFYLFINFTNYYSLFYFKILISIYNLLLVKILVIIFFKAKIFKTINLIQIINIIKIY